MAGSSLFLLTEAKIDTMRVPPTFGSRGLLDVTAQNTKPDYCHCSREWLWAIMLVQSEQIVMSGSDVPPSELDSLRGACRQLQLDLQIARSSNDELSNVASAYYERLEDEAHDRSLLESCLDQHKEALIEKTRELSSRDQLIKTQTFLLEFAWEDAQNFATLQAQKDHIISELRGTAAADGAAEKAADGAQTSTVRGKKRKLSS